MICAYQENVEIPSTTLGKYVIAPRSEGWGRDPLTVLTNTATIVLARIVSPVFGGLWRAGDARGWDSGTDGGSASATPHRTFHAPRSGAPVWTRWYPLCWNLPRRNMFVYRFTTMITSSTLPPPLEPLPRPSFNRVKLRYNYTTPFGVGNYRVIYSENKQSACAQLIDNFIISLNLYLSSI